ncbi:hypothetical protein H311_02333 [Anncaliia algerae PRA109]|nr:hypothetical protein H311_02333 [Anncaliia algerae PRA109]
MLRTNVNKKITSSKIRNYSNTSSIRKRNYGKFKEILTKYKRFLCKIPLSVIYEMIIVIIFCRYDILILKYRIYFICSIFLSYISFLFYHLSNSYPTYSLLFRFFCIFADLLRSFGLCIAISDHNPFTDVSLLHLKYNVPILRELCAILSFYISYIKSYIITEEEDIGYVFLILPPIIFINQIFRLYCNYHNIFFDLMYIYFVLILCIIIYQITCKKILTKKLKTTPNIFTSFFLLILLGSMYLILFLILFGKREVKLINGMNKKQ